MPSGFGLKCVLSAALLCFALLHFLFHVIIFAAALELDAKARKEEVSSPPMKKSRLYFTDSQKRALFAIFKETKKPSREMQNALAEELGLERGTVANFFMNARRRHPEL